MRRNVLGNEPHEHSRQRDGHWVLSAQTLPAALMARYRWSMCVYEDGQLHYWYTGYSTSTMPGAYQTTYDTTAVLTR